MNCSKALFSFSHLCNDDFNTTFQEKRIKFLTIAKKRSQNQTIIVHRINKSISSSEFDYASGYLIASELNEPFNSKDFQGTFRVFFQGTFPSLFHLNISSLSYNISDLHTFSSTPKIDYDVTAISKTRLKSRKPRSSNIDLDGYIIEHTPSKASCGEVAKRISFIHR